MSICLARQYSRTLHSIRSTHSRTRVPCVCEDEKGRNCVSPHPLSLSLLSSISISQLSPLFIFCHASHTINRSSLASSFLRYTSHAHSTHSPTLNLRTPPIAPLRKVNFFTHIFVNCATSVALFPTQLTSPNSYVSLFLLNTEK